MDERETRRGAMAGLGAHWSTHSGRSVTIQFRQGTRGESWAADSRRATFVFGESFHKGFTKAGAAFPWTAFRFPEALWLHAGSSPDEAKQVWGTGCRVDADNRVPQQLESKRRIHGEPLICL